MALTEWLVEIHLLSMRRGAQGQHIESRLEVEEEVQEAKLEAEAEAVPEGSGVLLGLRPHLRPVAQLLQGQEQEGTVVTHLRLEPVAPLGEGVEVQGLKHLIRQMAPQVGRLRWQEEEAAAGLVRQPRPMAGPEQWVEVGLLVELAAIMQTAEMVLTLRSVPEGVAAVEGARGTVRWPKAGTAASQRVAEGQGLAVRLIPPTSIIGAAVMGVKGK
jgi:hypothetical protein